jgi:hypothetical protein
MGKLWAFYKPNLLNISLAILCLGLTLKFIIPLFSIIKIVPCLISGQQGLTVCPMHPINPDISTLYLGFQLGDTIYLYLYLILAYIALPYTLSCAIFRLYYRYLKKEIS